MTPPPGDLHRLLRQLATTWLQAPTGVARDSGHCDSEIAAKGLLKWLEAAPSHAGAEQELERLARAWNLPGARGGSWKARTAAWAAAGARWGLDGLTCALEAQGFGPAWRLAQRRVRAVEIAFIQRNETNPPSSVREALRQDVAAWMQNEGGLLPAAVREQARDVLAATEHQGFWGAARALRAFCKHQAGLAGPGIDSLQQVLEGFGDLASPLFGLVPDPDWCDPRRRYRAQGARLDPDTGLDAGDPQDYSPTARITMA